MTMIIAVAQALVVLTGLKVIAVTTASTHTNTHTIRVRKRVTKSHLWILPSLVVFIMVLHFCILGRNAISTQQICSSIKATTLAKGVGKKNQ